MKITIISIGKIKEKNIRDAIFEYRKRLGPFARINEIELKPVAFALSTKEKAKKIECERILNILLKFEKENVFLLEENSKEYNSKEFAEFLEAKDKIVFVIAGSLGWSEELRNSKYKKLSLSKLTFPHEMARLILFEQIYRSLTIINGKEYHH